MPHPRSGTEVTDPDNDRVIITINGGFDALALIAMLGGVVQNIKKHLP